MEAKSVDEVPSGSEWQYEPKWDGFRCLAFRDGDDVELQSKAGETLARYFPEMVEAVRGVKAKRFVLDGELVIPKGKSLSFDDLLLRIHPAESRVKKLSAQTPALYVVFDLLVDERGTSLVARPLAERRKRLEAFAARFLTGQARIAMSPALRDRTRALGWFQSTRGTLDGVI
ncbi:MAG TPA: ATP-dependent DNA ligase, partial [Candidatus Bathyarchaeia archaeon]|nr:ATP-dependent DNA ligase [Candidatus Bathyarchaeia archaeon]